MKPNCYETYRSLTDCQLIDLILSGDTNASFYLISVKYQKELYKVICKYRKQFHTKFLDDTELEYRLYKFQDHMDTPTKIAGKSKFGQINDINNLKIWLCQCCKYFLLKWKETDNNYTVDPDVPDTGDYSIDSELEEQHREMQKRKALDCLCSSLSDRDTYIITAWLYCMEKGFAIIHFDEKIANVLSEHGWSVTAEYVRKIKSKSINKTKKFFKKHENFGDIFLLVIETDENFLAEKRKAIMQNLGIEQDFITDIINNEKKT